MKYKVLYILILGLVSVSCMERESLEAVSDNPKVSIPLLVSVSDEEGTTKSIDAEEMQIRNLWVIQFNGISGNSKIIGEPTYIEDFSTFDGTVELVSTNSRCAICFIANTFEEPGTFDINARTTVDDMLNLKRVISGETELLGSFYTIFNSWVEVDKVDTGLPGIETVLKRNISKVDITVSVGPDAVAENGLEVVSLQLCSVPSVSYYVTNRTGLTDPFPLSQIFSKINYPPVIWEDLDDDNSMTISAYLPANLRGKAPSGTGEKEKNRYAPDGATHLMVVAAYDDGGQKKSVIYTFYLGENMSDDYNLKPNYSYQYVFNITSVGDPESDYRIADWGEVDFTDTETYPLSNSYILNPAPVDDTWRYFKIPLEKANIFWGGQHGYGGLNTNYTLNNNSWEAFVLASDFAVTDDNFKIVRSSGTKEDKYFEVAVKSGVEGNVIVAAGTKVPLVSWSWHLWITDYDPSSAADLISSDGQYIYPVTGGAVHRYVDYGKNNVFWTDNPRTYIMDRNLGAAESSYYSEDKKGFTYYQFGRKDPFFAGGNYIYPDKSVTSRAARVAYDVANGSESDGMAYSVQNPLSYINADSNGAWVYSDYNPSSFDKNIIWNDPTTVPGGENEGKKSFFDPCPPGYRLPPSAIFVDFGYNNSSHPTTNITSLSSEKDPDIPLVRGFDFLADVKGLQYWPGEDDVSGQVLYFPAMGHYEQTSESPGLVVSNSGIWVSVWTQTPANAKYGYRLFARKGHRDYTSSTYRARAFPVRCVTDNWE